MSKLYGYFLRIVHEEEAQDMVEYALLAGFIAVAAGALLPPVATSLSTIFSKMISVTSAAAAK
jgi:Flp pilus assembly pilin Flp